MRRNRRKYLALLFATITLGLLSRTSLTPDFIYLYLGDFLYALMIFFIAGFIFTKTSSLNLALISIAACFLIELSQLYQADWINTIRSYKLGGLVLGHGFLWSDLISYAFGVMMGYFLEVGYLQKG